jgi:hypothetical protein
VEAKMIYYVRSLDEKRERHFKSERYYKDKVGPVYIRR